MSERLMTQARQPSINSTSFNCPYCGALAHQTWYSLYVRQFDKDETPFVPNNESLSLELPEEIKESLLKTIARFQTGHPFFSEAKEPYTRTQLSNVWVSCCYSCGRLSLWLKDRLVHPAPKDAEEPNEDIPADAKRDYDEARSVLRASSRAAAALLRLCIQKICREVGEKGNNLNEAIGNLVTRGLDVRVQQALDVVRVIGNNAVHPGQIDLRDNEETAAQLFTLVNLITEKIITEPKHIQEMFDSLPESARSQIAKRASRN